MPLTKTKILFATDGSPDAVLAARAAVDLSTRTGSELHVVHAWHSVPSTRFEVFLRGQLRREAEEVLDEQTSLIQDARGVVAEAHINEGPAIDEILDLAEEIGAMLGSRPHVRIDIGDPAARILEAAQDGGARNTLIAVGSRGLGRMQRIRLGSVSTKILRAAEGPVLINPPPHEAGEARV